MWNNPTVYSVVALGTVIDEVFYVDDNKTGCKDQLAKHCNHLFDVIFYKVVHLSAF